MLLDALRSCARPVDIVQVLYSGLRSVWEYDVVVLQILDQDDSYRLIAVDHGVLQDASRQALSESHFMDSFRSPRVKVMHPSPDAATHRGRGPGGGKKPRTVIWVPIQRGGKPIGAVLYQCDERREVTPEEIGFLESIHDQLGEILVAATLAYLVGSERFSTGDRTSVLSALASCVTEADVVQVLYASLRPLLGYDVVALQVLEREGWSHALAVDHGVLQDVRRGPLANTVFARNYESPATTVIHPDLPGMLAQTSRGPGVRKRPQTVIWVPILQRGQPLGSVTYQVDALREVSTEECAFLEELSSHLGAVVSAAYLNELTRNQAVRLTALNSIARSLASTHDEDGIVGALHSAIAPLLDCDLLELIVAEMPSADSVRILRADRKGLTDKSRLPGRRPSIAGGVLRTGQPRLRSKPVAGGEHSSAVWVPVREDNRVRAVLSIHSHRQAAYEQSTVAFLEQVADEVALALRNAWAYARVEAHGRRLEVVDAVGRRLASTLDRWSIMRAVREELAAHLEFDFFSVATIAHTPGGPVAEGYVFDGGEEQPVVAVPLAEAGPSREAYETGRPVLIGQSRWARAFAKEPAVAGLVYGDGAVLQPTRGGRRRRAAARSIVWVPIRHGEEIRALLSLQSYRPEMFDEWHVALLKDVAAHVSLALATAEQVEARDRQARMMEAILTHSPIGMVLEDDAGNVLYANAEVERIYGKESGAMIGRPTGHLLDEAGASPLSNPEAETNGALQYGLARKEMVIEVRRVPIRGAGRHRAGALSLHEDVTRQRSLLEAKDLMLRAIGHEVRSPAAAMRSTLAALLQWGPAIRSEQGQMLVQEAYEQSDRLLRLVESQLIIAKLETSGFETRPVPVALGRALEQVLRILHSRYGQRAAVVRCSLPVDLPEAHCEPAHLDQVLANLLGNALEYTQATQVLVTGARAGDWLEVTVQDNGGGLPVSLRDTLFAKAGLAGQNRARGGLGLGLYLCRLVVERSFGGRIWLSHTGPAGTAFKFTIPAAA
ncbi:GAF domain-containing protein [Candidatus Nephthysia bennettiae]|uniref:histidine kinase n=1 Tax=Candidatus Nephthysia bennettiae TaxID=3127016 RepID=A0A934K2M4_9BACT|nr:GAF domain-containing protein [Candidatus Dormibacteraeota bacterium]